MAETYEMFARDQTLLFNRFRKCLRGLARADWDIIVHGITLKKSTQEASIKTLIEEIVEEDDKDNLVDYMERTTKPRALKFHHWIRRIRHMNIYLCQIAGPTKQFTSKIIIRNFIAPSIPSSWKNIST